MVSKTKRKKEKTDRNTKNLTNKKQEEHKLFHAVVRQQRERETEGERGKCRIREERGRTNKNIEQKETSIERENKKG